MMVYSHGGFSRCFRIARRYQVDGPPVGVRYDDDKAAASGQPAAIAEETAWKEGWIILRDYYYYATPLMTYLLLFLFLWMINMEEDLVNDVSVPLAYMQQTSIEGWMMSEKRGNLVSERCPATAKCPIDISWCNGRMSLCNWKLIMNDHFLCVFSSILFCKQISS